MKDKENAEGSKSAIEQVHLQIRIRIRIWAAPCTRKISANRPQSRQKRLEDLHASTKHSSWRSKNSCVGSSAI
jgi:hypothetical protein